MKQSRSYDSTYRASQTEQTRTVILDALAEMVAEDGFEGIIVNDLAKRAGLSARTVYRHFPDRDALHDALADRLAGLSTSVAALGDRSQWAEVIEWVYSEFDREEIICIVGAKLNAVRGRSAADSVRRRSTFRDSIRESYPSFDDTDVDALLAVLLLLGSSRSWLRLKEEVDMTGAQSGPIVRWMLELVLADIDKRGGIPDDVRDRLSPTPPPM